jgi:hypothetical protein
MDVVSMLKSKDAFVPCRNLSFGNRLSLIAMEKAAAFPLRAGFMPNSPMPMLDVCDWLLLLTVSTTGGGRTVPCFFCWLSLLPPDGLFLPYWLWLLPITMVIVGLSPRPMVVVGVEELCCVLFLQQCVLGVPKMLF